MDAASPLLSADGCFSKRIARLCCRGFASAEATRGLSDRPLDPFGSPLPYFWDIVFYEPEVHWINTRAQHGSALDSIAQKGQGRNSLAGCRDSVPAGVKEQSPLGSPINTRTLHDSVTNSIARKGQGTKSLAESRGRASGFAPYRYGFSSVPSPVVKTYPVRSSSAKGRMPGTSVSAGRVNAPVSLMTGWMPLSSVSRSQ